MKHSIPAIPGKLTWLSLFVFGWSALGHTATSVQPAAVSPDMINSEIASRIHAINEMEIKVGHLAERKGSTAKVRRYGDRLVRDHELADRMILNLAKHDGLRITEPQPRMKDAKAEEKKHGEEMQKLESARGEEFDLEFVQMMKLGHDQAIAMLSDARDALSITSNLRKLIGKLLPILGQHDQLAEDLGSELGHSE